MGYSDGFYYKPAGKQKRIEERICTFAFQDLVFDEKHTWDDEIFSCSIKAGESLFYWYTGGY